MKKINMLEIDSRWVQAGSGLKNSDLQDLDPAEMYRVRNPGPRHSRDGDMCFVHN